MRFKRNRRGGVPGRPAEPGAEHQAWRPCGVAEEAEAYLAGRYVDHLVADGQPVPPWAVLNRLAHADHDQLTRLVAGEEAGRPAAPRRQTAWAEAERFLAAHLLATGGATPEGLARLQRDALVPLELALIQRGRTERLTSEDVLDAGSAALDSHHPGG
jgi:hypothetical protein